MEHAILTARCNSISLRKKGLEMVMTRRSLIMGSAAVFCVSATKAVSNTSPKLHVIKGRGCGCCSAWADLLADQGFEVTSEELHPADLIQLKLKKGVPQELASCHTAEIDGYIIEGHVPSADIRRLISERPDALGIGVAGMPFGSPGMGTEDEREQYDVVLFKMDNTTEIFNSYDSAN
ncbi:DUF411 domain-containing protein [Ahrensia sp. 13_GOM-1096m]|uniref:DUF411 domain-containing protein n=1 Tax=Ahrensia sp. 13_GOM-1096m TaxID=1380380 RepID=UPI001FFEF0F8|nr:DUF411 domain-containing protein [Ahrensia sp. 13_GOM-1096m]